MCRYILYAPEYIVLAIFLAFLGYKLKKRYLMAAGATLFLFLAYFFRSAPPPPPSGPQDILSPAEGTVLRTLGLANNRVLVSIFLSPLNVHVQYAPITGIIRRIQYKPGEFHPAYMFEKSSYNERVETDLETAAGPIKIIQLAGMLARRIVSFYKEGDRIERGEPFGLIKFGSRVDLIVPAGSGELAVREGDQVQVGTPLFKRSPSVRDIIRGSKLT
jgi:phosphatidylserine decarboxylase